MTLSNKQYQIILDLYDELNEEFHRLSPEVKDAFYARLYGR